MTGEDKAIPFLFILFTVCPIKHLRITVLQIYKEAVSHREDVSREGGRDKFSLLPGSPFLRRKA